MNRIEMKECSNELQRLGRIFEGPNRELFMNWTCSGLRFQFQGTCLVAELQAICGEEYENPFDKKSSFRKIWPYVAVFVDDQEEPISYFEVNDSNHNYMIFSSEKEERHVLTIRKMSENQKGKLSLHQFLTDGSIGKVGEEMKKLRLEFIGDSITCGFGNLSKERDRLFFAADENGWMSHAAVAARKLNAEFSIISCSGIATSKGLGKIPWGLPSMPELYPYTDRMVEELQGKETFTEWDFTVDKPDVIVLNLGTNDAAVIEFNGEIDRGVQKFEEDYEQFLKLIREKNGEKPWIICALGSMDYYLYDNIKKVVDHYSRETGDQRISCFKYGRIRIMDGYGACGHPGLITQVRMGDEIVDYITEILKL